MIIRDMCERVISNILRLKVMREVGCLLKQECLIWIDAT
jgi:hypothetical protein